MREDAPSPGKLINGESRLKNRSGHALTYKDALVPPHAKLGQGFCALFRYNNKLLMKDLVMMHRSGRRRFSLSCEGYRLLHHCS
jgi:hypothetical protein